MSNKVLITGGAGFIGSHLSDTLLSAGYDVRVLDVLVPQVHGAGATRPGHLAPDVELQVGDVRDEDAVRRALRGVDAVFHLAAEVGVGQSMYELARYTSVNNFGTAVLLQALIDQPVGRVVVASSMSLYGEGAYVTSDGRPGTPVPRTPEDMGEGDWEVRDAAGEALQPRPTPETKPPSLASVYALSKFDQEQMTLLLGRAYAIPAVALRFFNVFGPRQALSNPYTGVLAIFASRLLNEKPPRIYEDGLQRRDFVHVTDVARACLHALTSEEAPFEVFNVGSGRSWTIQEIAERMARVLGRGEIAPEITGKYRAGDIRHCFADIGKARRLLGFVPEVDLDEGLEELAGWLEGQPAQDHVEQATSELRARGLMR